MSHEGERTRAGVAAWQRAGAALAEARRRELRALTDAEALVIADDLLRLAATLPPEPDDLGKGLIEQQRLFARLRA